MFIGRPLLSVIAAVLQSWLSKLNFLLDNGGLSESDFSTPHSAEEVPQQLVSTDG